MKKSTVEARARGVRLAYGTVFFCDQGLPFRDKRLTALRNASGFRVAAKFEKFSGLSPRSTDRRINPDTIRTPDVAKAAVAWRDKAIRTLAEVTADKNRPYKNHEVINTFLPDLASLRDALAETFSEIQFELHQHPDWQIADVGNLVCDRVQAGAPDAWHRTMCYLHEIESILGSKLAQLRETNHGKDKKGLRGFVCEVLAERYGTTYWTVVRAMRKGRKAARTSPPPKMLGLLLDSVPSGAQPKAAESVKQSKRGPTKYPPEETVWFEIGRKVEEKTQNGDPSLSEGDRIIAARNAVAKEKHYARDTVVRYDLRYRSWRRNHPA
jgi:hypothetical protein